MHWSNSKQMMKKMLEKYPSLGQILRYGIVGVLNNLMGYLLYLVITFFWLEPKIAITLFYPIGATMGYFGHAKYSFAHGNTNRLVVLRYALAYLLGYCINYILLMVFSDQLHFPHQMVQGVAIFVVAGFLFLMLKFFVFTSTNVTHGISSKIIDPTP